MLGREPYRAEMKFAVSGQRVLRQTWEQAWGAISGWHPRDFLIVSFLTSRTARTPLLTKKPDIFFQLITA
jgi:hypothetical protein